MILERGVEKDRYYRFMQIKNEYKIKSLRDIHLRVVMYGRVSTDRLEQKTSIANQEQFYSDYIKNNPNWEFVGEYIDEGITGTSTKKRENFQKMIEEATAGKFDLIITKEISRFARNTLDSIYYTRKLLENNVAVYFQNDNINTLDEDSELRLTIMSGIAQEEVAKLSKRVKFGHRQSIKNGTVFGNSKIYGYKKNNGKLVIEENEAEMIRYIFARYATGSTSTSKLEKELYSLGYRNYKGGKINSNVIKHIIVNPKYKGYYCGGKVEIVDLFSKKQYFKPEEEWTKWKDESGEIVPAIVDEEIWEKANYIYKERSEEIKSRKHSYKTKNLFTGKLICAEHEVPFWMKQHQIRDKEPDPSWVCSHKIKNGTKSCNTETIKESMLVSITADIINHVSDRANEVVERYISYLKEALNDNSNETTFHQLQSKITTLEQKKEKILEYNLGGHISDAEFLRRNNQYNEEMDKIKKELEKFANTNEENILGNVDKLKDTLLKYSKIEPEDINVEVVSDIFEKIYVRAMPHTEEYNNCMELKFVLNSGEIVSSSLQKKNGKWGRSGYMNFTI